MLPRSWNFQLEKSFCAVWEHFCEPTCFHPFDAFHRQWKVKARKRRSPMSTGSPFQCQNGYWDLLFWYIICPTQPIFTNTETAMLSTPMSSNYFSFPPNPTTSCSVPWFPHARVALDYLWLVNKCSKLSFSFVRIDFSCWLIHNQTELFPFSVTPRNNSNIIWWRCQDNTIPVIS